MDGYRNKCEFSIGPGPDGKRVVGFQLGTFRSVVFLLDLELGCKQFNLDIKAGPRFEVVKL